MGKVGMIVVFLYVLVGLYFLNAAIYTIVPMPQFVLDYDYIVEALAGLLLLFGAFTFNRYNTRFSG